jgi:hypothetical protein
MVYLVIGLIVLGLLSTMGQGLVSDPRPMFGTATYWMVGALFRLVTFVWYSVFEESNWDLQRMRRGTVANAVVIFLGGGVVAAI